MDFFNNKEKKCGQQTGDCKDEPGELARRTQERPRELTSVYVEFTLQTIATHAHDTNREHSGIEFTLAIGNSHSVCERKKS